MTVDLTECAKEISLSSTQEALCFSRSGKGRLVLYGLRFYNSNRFSTLKCLQDGLDNSKSNRNDLFNVGNVVNVCKVFRTRDSC